MTIRLALALLVGISLCCVNGDVHVLDPTGNRTVRIFPSVSASFGPRLPDMIRGYLYQVTPWDACADSLPPPSNPGLTPWVALLSRNRTAQNCTFDVKVSRAERAGAIGAIVYDDHDDIALITMGKPEGNPEPSIPAVFVSRMAGEFLREVYAANEAQVILTEYDYWQTYDRLMLGTATAGVALVCFTAAWLMVQHVRVQRDPRTGAIIGVVIVDLENGIPAAPRRDRPLTEHDIKRLELTTFGTGQGGQGRREGEAEALVGSPEGPAGSGENSLATVPLLSAAPGTRSSDAPAAALPESNPNPNPNASVSVSAAYPVVGPAAPTHPLALPPSVSIPILSSPTADASPAARANNGPLSPSGPLHPLSPSNGLNAAGAASAAAPPSSPAVPLSTHAAMGSAAGSTPTSPNSTSLHSHSHSHDHGHSHGQPQQASLGVVAPAAPHNTHSAPGLTTEACCAVCLEDYEDGDRLIRLPCGHKFHEACVVQWLTERQSRCPVCKANIRELLGNEGQELVGMQIGPGSRLLMLGEALVSAFRGGAPRRNENGDLRDPILAGGGAARSDDPAAGPSGAAAAAGVPPGVQVSEPSGSALSQDRERASPAVRIARAVDSFWASTVSSMTRGRSGSPAAAGGPGAGSLPQETVLMSLYDLEARLGVLARRLQAWYSPHFPELSPLVPEPLLYARVVRAMRGNRDFAAEANFEGMVDEPTASSIRAAARSSSGRPMDEERTRLCFNLSGEVVDLSDRVGRARETGEPVSPAARV